jgi:raw
MSGFYDAQLVSHPVRISDRSAHSANSAASDATPLPPQVFLGGTCGTTTWRRACAIPLLDAAQVSYYNPQLGVGEWTEACEALEHAAKTSAQLLLFVITGETRGVASLAEVAYLLAAGRSMALMIELIAEGALVDGQTITDAERRDLNRGRLYVRAMAAQHGVCVFDTVADAVQEAIAQIQHPLHPSPISASASTASA